jgi:spore coat polysaccharide biosynthesis protein SpsF
VILAILQARMSSTRLPGKVLKDVHGKPMILRQIERLRNSKRIDHLIVATSTDPTDDILVSALERNGAQVRRGPLDDVAKRFAAVIDEISPETVVRLTADCPLADPDVIDALIESHLTSRADYSSNTLKPTFPHGLDAEVFSAVAFAKLRQSRMSRKEREHVTYGFYSRKSDFRLNSYWQSHDVHELRWTVDEQPDLDFVRQVYDRLYDKNPNFSQNDVLELLSREPSLTLTESLDARNAR